MATHAPPEPGARALTQAVVCALALLLLFYPAAGTTRSPWCTKPQNVIPCNPSGRRLFCLHTIPGGSFACTLSIEGWRAHFEELLWLLAAGTASIPALRVFGRLSNIASRPSASTSTAKQACRSVLCTHTRALCINIERNSQSHCYCTQAVGGQPCVICAYVAEYLNYEFPYLFDRVLGGVLGACSCYLRVLPRAQLLHDTNISHALIVSGTNGDAWPSFAADMAATRGRADLKTLGLVHLGDEHLSDDVSGYPDFAFVLRNYLREDLPHGAQVPFSSTIFHFCIAIHSTKGVAHQGVPLCMQTDLRTHW